MVSSTNQQRAEINKARSSAVINVHLIIREDEKVLLHLRQNTGFNDGFYGLVAGHVEEGESSTAAMIREAKEEAGISIEHNDLKVVHVMHRRTNRNNIDIFFECSKWQGCIENKEPEKCARLVFQSIDHLPTNLIPYIRQALHAEELYSEEGY